MLKSERLTRDLQMACFQHADSSKNQSIKIIICLFSAFYARISKSIQSFAHEMTTVLPRMAETEQTFPVGVHFLVLLAAKSAFFLTDLDLSAQIRPFPVWSYTKERPCRVTVLRSSRCGTAGCPGGCCPVPPPPSGSARRAPGRPGQSSRGQACTCSG